MGFWSRLIGRRDRTSDFITFADLIQKTASGVAVTQENATTLPSVFRCISLNSETVSTLPVGAFVKKAGKRVPYQVPVWMKEPNDEMDFGHFVQQMQASLEYDGNAFALKVALKNGQLAALYPLNPTMVEVGRGENNKLAYRVKQAGGEWADVRANEMLHVRGFTAPGALRGMSPIEVLKQSIGLGLAAEQFGAQFFGTGATLSGVITMPGAMPDAPSVERLRENFTRKHGGLSKSHAVGILSGGAQWVPLSVKPEEAQFLETRKYTDVQIASLYGVPPEYVTDAEGAKGYVTGLYARQYMWLQTGINIRLVRLERAFTALLPEGAYVKFNRNAFLAMDPTERAAYYESGLRGRWMVPNEIREKEDESPLPGGDEALWSVQWGSEPDQVAWRSK